MRLSSMYSPNMLKKFKTSLQELCLECIVDNFEQLMNIYNSASGSAKCFEFLQRTHSRTLLNRFAESDSLKDKYLTFLINPFLKHLDLSAHGFVNIDVIIERLKIVGSHIISLDIRDKYYLEDTILELITLVPNVEALYLAHTESTDNVMNCIAKHCTLLHTLDVSFCHITADGLKSLCNKDETGELKENHIMKNLLISSTSVGDDGISFALAHFPALEELNYDNIGGTIFKAHKAEFLENTLDSLQKYNLRKLNIQSSSTVSFQLGGAFSDDAHEKPAMKDVLKVCSILCPQVSCLCVDSVITQSDMLVCTEFPQLKEVKLCSSPTDLINYAPFVQISGKHLTQIDLDNGIISAEVLGECCPNLEKLILQSIRFEKLQEGAMMSKPALFPKLKFLFCEGMELLHELKESVAFLVNSSPALEVLHLQYCRYVSEDFVSSLLNSKCMATLKKVDMSYSDTTYSTVRKLVAVTVSLEKLYIEDCEVSDTEYHSLIEHLESENRCIKVLWKIGSTDYESDYDNEFPFLEQEYEFHNYDFDYMTEYDDDYDPDYYDFDPDDIDYFNVEDYM